jgi:hypothetical protein
LGCDFSSCVAWGVAAWRLYPKAASGCIASRRWRGAAHMYTEYLSMENLTQLERFFLDLLRGLDEQQRLDVLRILKALQHSTE